MEETAETGEYRLRAYGPEFLVVWMYCMYTVCV